jgi:large subunit ribosomal protein L4
MATLDVVTIENSKAGSVDVSATVFEADVKPHLFQAEVRRQLAQRRSGTHSTKNRARVSGGGAKPYRQKGTGRARQGTTRAPQFAGGGVVFGPVPHGYVHKLNKKTRRAALRSALSWKHSESDLTVLESLEFDDYKTKQMVALLDALGLSGRTVLFVIEEPTPTVVASAANIPGVEVIRAEGLNVYDVLRHQTLVFTKSAVSTIEARLGEPAAAAAAEKEAGE